MNITERSERMQRAIVAAVHDEGDEPPTHSEQMAEHLELCAKYGLTKVESDELWEIMQGPIGY